MNPRLRVVNLPDGEFLIVLDRCDPLWVDNEEADGWHRLRGLRENTGAKTAVVLCEEWDVGVATVDVEPTFEFDTATDDGWVGDAVAAVKGATDGP